MNLRRVEDLELFTCALYELVVGEQSRRLGVPHAIGQSDSKALRIHCKIVL